MPLYEYACLACRVLDTRVAGLDDRTALCIDCGGIMVRLEEDIFQAYFMPDPGGLEASEARLIANRGRHKQNYRSSPVCLPEKTSLKPQPNLQN